MKTNKLTNHFQLCMCDKCLGRFTMTTGREEVVAIVEGLKMLPDRPLVTNLLIKLEDYLAPD